VAVIIKTLISFQELENGNLHKLASSFYSDSLSIFVGISYDDIDVESLPFACRQNKECVDVIWNTKSCAAEPLKLSVIFAAVNDFNQYRLCCY